MNEQNKQRLESKSNARTWTKSKRSLGSNSQCRKRVHPAGKRFTLGSVAPIACAAPPPFNSLTSAQYAVTYFFTTDTEFKSRPVAYLNACTNLAHFHLRTLSDPTCFNHHLLPQVSGRVTDDRVPI